MLYSTYKDAPELFCREVLGEDIGPEDVLAGTELAANAPWASQVEVMESVRDHQRTVVRASHSCGKTHIAARVGLWFLYTRAPAIVITTAPKATQVRDLLWGRWRAAWSQSRQKLAGECLLTRCSPIAGDSEWFAVGHTARDAESFQRYHEAHVLLIFDEAPGVPAFIYEAAEGILSGLNTRILLIGNPTVRAGPFYQACASELWHSLHVSAWDHPNVVYDRPIYAKAVAPTWPAERLKEWGADHPMYKSRVCGEFPDQGEDTLIPLSWVEACVGREVSTDGPKALGVDVARFGLDETVLYLITGHLATMLEAYNGRDLMQTAGRVKRWLPAVDVAAIDDAGLGGGVTDRLKEDGDGGKVMPVNAGSKALAPKDFANLGSQMMWALRLAIQAGYEAEQRGGDAEAGISLPDDPRLIAQLSGRTYDLTSAGQIKVQSKGDMTGGGDPSPDRADALAIAYWATAHKRPVFVSERVYG